MSTRATVSWLSQRSLRVRTSGWRIDRVSVVIADGANHEFMIYHELFGGLSIMSLN
jgi:hypothetical protein